jgi:hypothetical protein
MTVTASSLAARDRINDTKMSCVVPRLTFNR